MKQIYIYILSGLLAWSSCSTTKQTRFFNNFPSYEKCIENGKRIMIISFILPKEIEWVYSTSGETIYAKYPLLNCDNDYHILEQFFETETGLSVIKDERKSNSMTYSKLLRLNEPKMHVRTSEKLLFFRQSDIYELDILANELTCDYFIVSELWTELPAVSGVLGSDRPTDTIDFYLHFEIYDHYHQIVWVDEVNKTYEQGTVVSPEVVETWLKDFIKFGFNTFVNKLKKNCRLGKGQKPVSAVNKNVKTGTVNKTVNIPAKNAKNELIYQKGEQLIKAKQYNQALTEYYMIIQQDSKDVRAAYNIVRVYSIINDKQSAIKWFKYLMQLDRSVLNKIRRDPDFYNLRYYDEYKEIVNK